MSRVENPYLIPYFIMGRGGPGPRVIVSWVSQVISFSSGEASTSERSSGGGGFFHAATFRKALSSTKVKLSCISS